MSPEKVNFPITFEKGLHEHQEESVLDTGQLSMLENWIPEPSGALRARRRFQPASAAGAPATRRTRGIGVFSLTNTTATPQLRQKAEASGNPVSPSWPVVTAAGSLLLAVVQSSTGGIVPSFTPPAGWTLVVDRTYPASRVAMYYIQGAASRSGAETFTSSQGSTMKAQLYEFTGIVTTGALDQTASASGTSTSPASGTTPATTQATELAFAVLAHTSSTTNYSNPTNGYVIEETTLPIAGLYKVLTATGAASTGATIDTSMSWAGLIATFKAASISQTGGRYLVADDDGANFDIWAIDKDALNSATWTLIDGNRTASDRRLPVKFADGLGAVLYTHPEFSVTRRWDGATAADVTNAPRGRAMCFYRNRFFIGGTKAGAFGANGTTSEISRLWYSDLGSYTAWNNNNFIDVGRDDGDAIEDIAPVGDGLLIAKRNSLWFLSGTGPDNFHLTELEDGGGHPGSSICVGPFGAMVAGSDHVWLWSGGRPELMSNPIMDSYSIGGEFVSTRCVGDVVYICDSGSGVIWAHDHMHKTWWLETLPPGNDQPAIIGGFENQFFYGPLASTTVPPLAYRNEPGTEHGRDVGLPTSYVAETGELFPGGAGRSVTPRHLYVQVRQRGGNENDAGLVVTPTYDGTEQAPLTIAPRVMNGGMHGMTFRQRLDIGSVAGVYGVKVRFEQDNTITDDAVMDIERVEFIGLVSPHR